jgi:hypothetical protein
MLKVAFDRLRWRREDFDRKRADWEMGINRHGLEDAIRARSFRVRFLPAN